jgi:hypothetical protein
LSFSPFPSLQRYNTNLAITANKQTVLNPSQNYTYKDYQSSSANHLRPNVDASSQPQPLTAIYTFPSLLKPNNNNWRKPQQQQQSTIDASSSAWRVFGVNHLPY